MKKNTILLVFLAFVFNTNAQVNVYVPNGADIGIYKVGTYGDSLHVTVENGKRKNKRAFMEYSDICKINDHQYISNILIGAKKDNVMELVETLIYIRKKADEWTEILKSRDITDYEKVFKEASFPRMDAYVIINKKTSYQLWNNKHYIKQAKYVEEDAFNYKIVLNIVGSKVIDEAHALTLYIDNNLVLYKDDLDRLIELLHDAANLCEAKTDLDDLLTE